MTLPAQSVIPVKAGLISYAGDAYLDDRPVAASANHMVMMKAHDVVRTGADRAEVLLGPCSAMWIDEGSSFRLVSNALDDVRLEVLRGSVVVAVGDLIRGTRVTLLLQSSSAGLDGRGAYRFDAGPPRLKTLAGRIALQFANRTLSIPAGRTFALDSSTEPARFDRQNPDGFETWSKGRAAYLARLSGQQKTNRLEPPTGDEASSRVRSANNPSHFPIPPDGLPNPPSVGCGVTPW